MTPAEPEHNGKDGRDMLYETIAFPDNAPLQCSIVEVEEYPFHMHDDVLEIMFALEGSFELTVVNNVLDMKAGDIYVSCPRELHRLCAYPHTRGTVMLLHINVEAYRAEFPDLRTYQFANSALENNTAGIQMLGSYLKKQLPRLLDRTGTETAAYREVGEKILNTLIKEFQCYYLGSGFPEFNNAYKGNELQLRRIRRITDYIYRNYNKPIRIEDVAAMEHISANHLTNILKNGCGVGFRTFLNMARVEKSAAMLLEGGKGLQTIAYECGFSKYKYFSDSFERAFAPRHSSTGAGTRAAPLRCRHIAAGHWRGRSWSSCCKNSAGSRRRSRWTGADGMRRSPSGGPGASAWRVPPTTTSPAFRSCGGCGRSWGWTPLRLIWTFCAVTGTAPEC